MEKINNVMDLMKILDTIEYGWMDIDKNVYLNTEKGFKKKYVLSHPEDVLEKKVGNNFDQVELERSLFKNLETDKEFICWINSVIYGHSLGLENESLGENTIRKWLEEHNIYFQQEYSFEVPPLISPNRIIPNSNK